MGEAIVVQNLGKQFQRFHPDRPMTLQEAIVRGLRRLGPEERFWALREVSFVVPHGRMVGILGANGAGKSTLLRLVGGCGRPDEGRIQVQGRIGALLDLSAGFHPDLTGRDNIYIAGVIGGLTRGEIARRFDSIVEFAELNDFIDSPLRTYSSGMQMRLGFSVAAHIEPEILLIDEVLAVGDIAFQQKCLARIREFRAKGGTILLVSHDRDLIEEMCDEAIWLRGGRIAAHGVPSQVAEQYVNEMLPHALLSTRGRQPSHKHPTEELRMYKNRFGSLEVEITAVRRLDREAHPAEEITGGALRVEIDYIAHEPVPSALFYVSVTRPDGLCCFESSAVFSDPAAGMLQGSGTMACVIEHLDLKEGRYNVDLGIYESNWEYAYDYQWEVYPVWVRASTDPADSDQGATAHWQIQPVPDTHTPARILSWVS